MAKKQRYTDETKAAVLAALLAGQGVSRVAEEYNIPLGTVKSWNSRIKNQGDPVAKVATQKKEDIGNLLLEYLRTNLATLQKQAEHFSDTAWLHKQSGADLAVLHGVLADKTVRLLEALQAGSE